MKFKITSEDLEVRCEDFKQIEIAQKKNANSQIKAVDVYNFLSEMRTKFHDKYSIP
jgi:hypothetical protein